MWNEDTKRRLPVSSLGTRTLTNSKCFTTRRTAGGRRAWPTSARRWRPTTGWTRATASTTWTATTRAARAPSSTTRRGSWTCRRPTDTQSNPHDGTVSTPPGRPSACTRSLRRIGIISSSAWLTTTISFKPITSINRFINYYNFLELLIHIDLAVGIWKENETKWKRFGLFIFQPFIRLILIDID